MGRNPQDLVGSGANKDDTASSNFKNILHVACFPNLIEPREHTPSDIYCRILSMAGNGFPFWPGSTPILREPYTRRTIEVGDVGYINQMGNFEFAFNLFLPSDDPLNQFNRNKLPEGYVPLDPPYESEISRIPGYYPPGSVIATKGIDVHRLGENPLHLKFTSSEPEVAVLVLPDGARREDLATSRVQEYLKKHAENWIQFFTEENVFRAIPNGGIYVITGIDKAVSYSASTFPGRGYVGNRRISFEYEHKFRQLGRKTGIASYNWKTSERDTEERCLFFRGIRIGLSHPEWNLRIDEVHPDSTPVSVLPQAPPISDQILPAKQDGKPIQPGSDNYSKGLDIDSHDKENQDIDSHDEENQDIDSDDEENQNIDSDDEEIQDTEIHDEENQDIDSDDEENQDIDSDDEEIQDPVVDPIVKVQNIMLSQGSLYQYPDAKVALVDDYIWSNAIKHSRKSDDPLTFKCSQGAFVADWGSLLENIFKSHEIVEKDDLVASQYMEPTEAKATCSGTSLGIKSHPGFDSSG
ncbi:hypothetical protein JR316_0004412 [Psilocybe cubensis]|uniref:Uncharacterized protein n=1 Tax=Psilocybe cubensis TaxID=181762 RepID=A0ACB8H526_PSICU|nr:hypothetical protein JR316_0004412 [Psilocybe cubensis]KAH9482314.1 hypothetical protein JR316_0004412 [Psilocybe cubensis]